MDLQVPARHAYDLRNDRERTSLGIAVDALLRAADAGGLPSLTIARRWHDTWATSRSNSSDTLWLERADAAWQVAANRVRLDKGPHRGGPLKEAFRNRFVFVYGTAGTPEENAWMLARARFDAETFWYRGNGSVDVIADTQWKSVAETDRSVVVYGNATINSAWRELLGDGPVLVERGRWQVSHRTAAGEVRWPCG